jgi:magnesium transporter
MPKPKVSRRAERKRRRRRDKARGLHTEAGTLHVDPAAPKPVVHVCAYGPGGFECGEGPDPAELERLRSRWPVTWVHVVGLGDAAVIEALGRTFEIHRLALADVVHEQQRPKVQRWGGVTQIVARMVDEVGSSQTEQLSIFVGRDFVLSFEQHKGELFSTLRERLRADVGDVREGKSDFLAYALLDVVIDEFFPVVEQIGDELDQIEDDLPTMAQPQITPRLRQVKQDLLHIRRALWPLRDVLGGLVSGQCPYVQEETRNYLRDCQDHCAQLIDIVGLYRELAADLVDLQLAVASQRMNEVMKVLTVMATVFIPLTFISSIYGMNFDPETSPLNMPELKWFWGYPFALALMAATAAGLLVYFRRRGWI